MSLGACFLRHFLQFSMDLQNYVLQLFELLGVLVFSQDGDSYLCTEFVGKCHIDDWKFRSLGIVEPRCYVDVNSVLINCLQLF